MNILVGVILALAIGVGATWVGFDRDRAFYPTVTLVVGSYYILFAAMGGSTHTVLIESLVFVPFLVAAVLGFARTPWIVALALAAHGCLDLVHDPVDSGGCDRRRMAASCSGRGRASGSWPPPPARGTRRPRPTPTTRSR